MDNKLNIYKNCNLYKILFKLMVDNKLDLYKDYNLYKQYFSLNDIKIIYNKLNKHLSNYEIIDKTPKLEKKNAIFDEYSLFLSLISDIYKKENFVIYDIKRSFDIINVLNNKVNKDICFIIANYLNTYYINGNNIYYKKLIILNNEKNDIKN